MPSLIYIARISSLSEELAKTLRSAGCHVRSFKPGDITEDECLLAMTSEAVATTARADGQTGAETPGAAALAGPDVSEPLGSHAAVWNSIRKAVTAESQANRQPVAPVASTEEPNATVGVTLTRVERQEVSRPQDRAAGQIPPSSMIPVSSPDVSYPPRKIRATKEQVYRVFRNPLSTVVALLIFSVVYRGLVRPARTEVTIGHAANYHARSDPDSANLPMVLASPGQSAHRSAPLGPSSVRPLKPADDRVQRHLSGNGSVAGDFTNRLALRAQGQATAQQNPDLKHPPGRSIQKRVVVD